MLCYPLQGLQFSFSIYSCSKKGLKKRHIEEKRSLFLQLSNLKKIKRAKYSITYKDFEGIQWWLRFSQSKENTPRNPKTLHPSEQKLKLVVYYLKKTNHWRGIQCYLTWAHKSLQYQDNKKQKIGQEMVKKKSIQKIVDLNESEMNMKSEHWSRNH